jgi:aminomethyltransferase
VRKDHKRVGFMLDGKGIIRENCKILNDKGEEVGKTSSGGFSPVLKKCIGMAYVDSKYAKAGTKLVGEQREVKHPLSVVKLPVVASRYSKGWNDFGK